MCLCCLLQIKFHPIHFHPVDLPSNVVIHYWKNGNLPAQNCSVTKTSQKHFRCVSLSIGYTQKAFPSRSRCRNCSTSHSFAGFIFISISNSFNHAKAFYFLQNSNRIIPEIESFYFCVFFLILFSIFFFFHVCSFVTFS